MLKFPTCLRNETPSERRFPFPKIRDYPNILSNYLETAIPNRLWMESAQCVYAHSFRSSRNIWGRPSKEESRVFFRGGCLKAGTPTQRRGDAPTFVRWLVVAAGPWEWRPRPASHPISPILLSNRNRPPCRLIADESHVRNPRYPLEKRRRRPMGIPPQIPTKSDIQPRRPIRNPDHPETGCARPAQRPPTCRNSRGKPASSTIRPRPQQTMESQLPSVLGPPPEETRGGYNA